jgi:hypothetical protein
VKRYKDFVNEGVRDKMTPKPEEEIKRQVRNVLKDVMHPLSDFPPHFNPEFKKISELFDRDTSDLHILEESTSYYNNHTHTFVDNHYEEINEYFEMLVEDEEKIRIRVRETKDFNGGHYDCYPNVKLAYWTSNDFDDPHVWVFSKSFFVNEVNESVRDRMTPISDVKKEELRDKILGMEQYDRVRLMLRYPELFKKEELRKEIFDVENDELKNIWIIHTFANLFTDEEKDEAAKGIIGEYFDFAHKNGKRLLDRTLLDHRWRFFNDYKVGTDDNGHNLYLFKDIVFEIVKERGGALHLIRTPIRPNEVIRIHESVRDRMTPKSKEDIKNLEELRHMTFVNQNKAKYDVLDELVDMGFNFDSNLKRTLEPGFADTIGSFVIFDFIKEHKKVIPNFNRLSYSEQNKSWDDSMKGITDIIKNTLSKYDFELKELLFGNGDLLVKFTTSVDDLLYSSVGVPKIVTDTKRNA